MAHNNTILSQMLDLVPRYQFDQIVNKYSGNYRLRTFKCWSHFVCLAYSQIAHQYSLRDLVTALRSQLKKIYHLGIQSVSRSTLATANEKRNNKIYEELFYLLYHACSSRAPGHKFKFKHKVYTLDSSTVDLCLSLFRWAKFRKRKGAIKIHTLLDHCGHLPSCVIVTEGKKHDIMIARKMRFEPDSIIIIDRGYVDYCWLFQLHLQEAYFVTRLKKNVRYTIVKRNKTTRSSGITSDHIIRIKGTKADCIPIELRKVRFVDKETGQVYVFLTNIFHLSAKEIADLYKERWQIELFFKWIKQHLKIKSFLGTSKNAVLTQIWVALCVYLLITYLKFLSKCSCTLYEIKKRLQVNILEKLPLRALLRPDLYCQSIKTESTQLHLAVIL